MASAYQKLLCDFDDTDRMTFTNGTGSELDGATLREESETLGMVLDPVKDGNEGVLIYKAPRIKLPKASVAFAKGDQVTWDSADSEVNADTTNNPTIGRAVEDAASGDAEVVVHLTNEQAI
jgi:predicted RecA/RadA family phage recombinase